MKNDWNTIVSDISLDNMIAELDLVSVAHFFPLQKADRRIIASQGNSTVSKFPGAPVNPNNSCVDAQKMEGFLSLSMSSMRERTRSFVVSP